MGSSSHSAQYCYNLVNPLHYEIQSSPELSVNLTYQNVKSLLYFCEKIGDLEVEEKYSKPMVWIGNYIAIASLLCILAMVADLLHGFQSRKLWFPCKYFSLNAASITVITVAMKLPVDLSSPMPGYVDQAAKMGSMAFMCTMMANIMPSLASMDNKALFANVTGLAILVITMIVNTFIEINTGVINHVYFTVSKFVYMNPYFALVAYIYIAMLLLLLMIVTSSAIIIPTFKRILELKYQATSKTTLDDQHLQHRKMLSVEKLRQDVRRYLVMAETGSPQFVMASNPSCSACGIICLLGLVMYMLMGSQILLRHHDQIAYQSEYKWSMLAILITQSTGVIVGTIAPIIRCFTVLNKNRNHKMVFKVEKYWTQMLCEWKESHISFLSNGHSSRTLFHNLKKFILSYCIRLQKVIAVSCKIIGLIPVTVHFFFVYCSYCCKSLKAMQPTSAVASSNDDIKEDLRKYVLQLEEEMELAQETLKGISKSMNRLMQKAEKLQQSNLLKLLERSTGFEGLKNFDIDQVQPLLSFELFNGWSLPVVTLTCIAITLPKIGKGVVDRLFRSVGEGLSYTYLVEQCLNNTSEYANIQRAAMILWHEVEGKCKWLENTLEKSAFKGKTAREILNWFADEAEKIVIELNRSTSGELAENPPNKLIAANSMYRIAKTILLTYQSHIEPISEEELFSILSCIIADILFACFTNIPRVITQKCHESVLEKREAIVEAAAKLLGRTTEIINRLEARELPDINPDRMEFFDEWRLHLKLSIP